MDLLGVYLWIFTAATIWFLRHSIQRWASKGVEHYFDEKLEELKSTFRKNEEEFKADLQRKEKEIETLRSPATQMQIARGNTLAQREIDAYALLWETVHKMYPFKMAAKLMFSINIEKVCENKVLDQNTTDFFKSLYEMSNLAKLPPLEGYKARPFVSEACWAKFAAFSAIGGYATAVLAMFKSGLAKQELLKEDDLRRLVSVALPHQMPLLDKYGVSASFDLLDELEEAIISQIRKELRGNGSIEVLENTKQILDAAAKLSAQTAIAEAPPRAVST